MSALPARKRKRVELGFAPYAHQAEAHRLRQKFRNLVLVWHRRGGKTVFVVVELILAAVTAKRTASRFAYIAPLLKQSKAVAWDYLKAFALRIDGVQVHEADLSVTFPNGANVRLYGADNPDGLRGVYFDGVVLDEVADMKPEVWGEIVRPALADRQGWSVWIGTPKGINLFSDGYLRGERGEEGWKSDLRRWKDTNVLPEAEVESARKEMSPAQFAQEFECDFAAATEDTLLRLDQVLEAQARVYGEAEYNWAPRVLGVDVARYGGDRTVLFPRQGLAALVPTILRGASTMEVASRVAQEVDAWKPDAVFLDVGGVGAGVVDRLLQLGYPVTPVDFGSRADAHERFENKRCEMWWRMAEWVKSGRLPAVAELQRDLTAPRYSFANARGRVELESKDDMRRRGLPSPDVGDALALTFASPVVPRADMRGTGHALTEYNPFAPAEG